MHVRAVVVIVLAGVALAIAGCNGPVQSTESGSDDSTTVAPVNGYQTEPANIYVDERVGEWAPLTVDYADDENGSGLDVERVSVAHDAQHLFLRIDLGQRINLQEENSLTVHLDTDNDISTGEEIFGIGADVRWSFGERTGKAYHGGSVVEIGHSDVGISSLPTVRSNTFEIAFDRAATPFGSSPTFEQDTLRLAISSDDDRVPDEDGGIGYVLSETDLHAETEPLGRSQSGAVRVLSYNVLRDALFEQDVQPRYRRIVRAIQPDIMGFQEVYEHSAEETGRLVERFSDRVEEWSWTKGGEDLVVGSQYPIVDSHTIPGYDDYRSLAVRLDADEALGTDLVVVNMHPPCCNYGPEDGEPSSNAQRQQVVDGVVAFLRDLKRGEAAIDVPDETPVVIVGDMNFVGSAQQPRTLRTGEIVNTDRFGAGAAPDWDDTSLLDTRPRQTGTPIHTTWIDSESSFPPGRLDYALITDSVLEVVREYVLRTSTLSGGTLSEHGLEKKDTAVASDHHPVVIDLTAK